MLYLVTIMQPPHPNIIINIINIRYSVEVGRVEAARAFLHPSLHPLHHSVRVLDCPLLPVRRAAALCAWAPLLLEWWERSLV